MAFNIIEDEAPITSATVDLTPYKEVVQTSYDGSKTLGIEFDSKKEASVALNRFRSAADSLGFGLRSEIVENGGKFKVRLMAKTKRAYTLSEDAKVERTRKAAETRKANKAKKEAEAKAIAAANEPAPKGSRAARK